MKKLEVLFHPHSTLSWLRSDCMDAQADLRLTGSTYHFASNAVSSLIFCSQCWMRHLEYHGTTQFILLHAFKFLFRGGLYFSVFNSFITGQIWRITYQFSQWNWYSGYLMIIKGQFSTVLHKKRVLWVLIRIASPFSITHMLWVLIRIAWVRRF